MDFIDRGGAMCGLYRQGWGTVRTYKDVDTREWHALTW